ncbi:cell division protease FtsH [Bartonella sp. JB15]|nr:cell division protease FtsH [Bartonella sp. JB15]
MLEYETLTGTEINDIIKGKPPARTLGSENDNSRTSVVPKIGKKGRQDTTNLKGKHELETSGAEKKSRSKKNKAEANKSDKTETGNVSENKEKAAEKSNVSKQKKKQTPANDA